MPTTTSRLHLLQPIGSDPPSELRIAITQNTETLDAAVTFTEGPISSLPAASLAGRRYYATDLGQMLYDTGSSWIPTSSGTPIGAMSQYAGSTDPIDADGTTRWLVCDGRAISRTTYAHLFNAISTTYGSGNGSSTFNIPDGRGRAIVGAGSGSGLTPRSLAATGGEETHLLAVGEMPSHNHDVTDPGHDHGLADWVPGSSNASWVVTAFETGTVPGGNGIINSPASVSNLGAAASNTTGVTTDAYGGGGSHNNMQPFLVVNHIIKVL